MTVRKESVVVNGFAEASPKKAKQGKDSHMILFSKTARKFFNFLGDFMLDIYTKYRTIEI